MNTLRMGQLDDLHRCVPLVRTVPRGRDTRLRLCKSIMTDAFDQARLCYSGWVTKNVPLLNASSGRSRERQLLVRCGAESPHSGMQRKTQPADDLAIVSSVQG